MFPGFLPFSRASFMLDFVTLAMAFIVPVLGWSIYQVRVRKNYGLHRKTQLCLGVVLLVAVVLFEVDIRVYGWRQFAQVSPYYTTILFPILYVHLFFAISTTFLWIYVVVMGLKRFPNPPGPNEYSASHRRWGKLAAVDMCCTTVTGWTFYYMAFVANAG